MCFAPIFFRNGKKLILTFSGKGNRLKYHCFVKRIANGRGVDFRDLLRTDTDEFKIFQRLLQFVAEGVNNKCIRQYRRPLR